MSAPTKEELAELAKHSRKLEYERDRAWNRRNLSPEAYLDYEVVSYRYRMASDHLGARIREYIESGASGVVRP